MKSFRLVALALLAAFAAPAAEPQTIVLASTTSVERTNGRGETAVAHVHVRVGVE